MFFRNINCSLLVMALLISASRCPAPIAEDSSDSGIKKYSSYSKDKRKKIGVDFSSSEKLSGKIEDSSGSAVSHDSDFDGNVKSKNQYKSSKDEKDWSPELINARRELWNALNYVRQANGAMEKENAEFALRRAQFNYEKARKEYEHNMKNRKFWSKNKVSNSSQGQFSKAESDKPRRLREGSPVVIETEPEKITTSLANPKL